MKNAKSIADIEKLKQQLYFVRHQSLLASRQNDFRTVARLTAEAARINRTIQTEVDFADSALKSLTVVNALAHFDDEGHFEFPEEPRPAVVQKLEPTLQEAA